MKAIWQFETIGNGNANIELTPTSGAVGSPVQVAGAGFNPNSNVNIAFGSLFNFGPVPTDNNGEFSADFTVSPLIAKPRTVTASNRI
jgi:hypothetical protein